MKSLSSLIAVAIVFGLGLTAFAAEKVAPVRMGSGAMTFDTVPGWGLDPDGKSQIGPTHGSVVIDKAGNIYTSADAGVFVFSPDGKVIRRHLGEDYSRIHDMEIRDEADGEFIYGARNANAEGFKFNAQPVRSSEAAFPRSLDWKRTFNPTALRSPQGDIFCLTVMRATIFSNSTRRGGEYLKHFGIKGNDL